MHSHLKLNYDNYFETENFIIHNEILTKDYRGWPYGEPNKYEWLKIDKGQVLK